MEANRMYREIEAKIKEIVIELLQLEKTADMIDSDENLFLEEYGYNSIDALELSIKIENEFDISIQDEDLNAELVQSVGSLTRYVVNAFDTKK